MSRRRLGPPLIPGLWSIVAMLVLLSATAGYFYALARLTTFTRVEQKAD